MAFFFVRVRLVVVVKEQKHAHAEKKNVSTREGLLGGMTNECIGVSVPVFEEGGED